MAETRLPYKQALKLQAYMLRFRDSGALCDRLEQFVKQERAQVERQRQRLLDVAEFEGIPLDKTNVDVRLEDGPTKGMIKVIWEDEG